MMSLFHILRRWARDEHGTITMEFVLWVPVLLFWFAASAAFFDAYKSRTDAAKAAHTISDITSRQVEVTDAFIAELYALESALLPRVSAAKQLRVSSIQYDGPNDVYQVIWSSAPGSGGLPLVDADIPLGLMPEMANLDSVILTEISVPYQPFTSWAGIEANSWSFNLVSKPRFVTAIVKTDAPPPGS